MKLQNTFNSGLSRWYADKFRNALIEGQKLAADALIYDVFSVAPTVPLDTGLLREAWAVYVDGRIYKKGSAYSGPDTNKSKQLVFVFDTEYALIIHEELAPAGQLNPGPGSISVAGGGGFLSSKLQNNAGRYMKIIRDEIARAAFTG